MNINTALEQCYDNMIAGRYYVRGKRESATAGKVLASRNGNKFNPGVCYWDYVRNLPRGTHYIDCERPA